MKKISKSILDDLYLNTLYFDDIKNIYDIFKENGDRVSISTDNYTDITDVNELKKIDFKDIEFHLHSKDNLDYITLKFSEKNTSFYSNSDTVFSLGFYSTIKQFLNKTKKSNLYKIRPIIVVLFWFLIWFFLSKISFSVIENEKYQEYIPIINFFIVIFISRDIKLFQYKNEFILNKDRVDYNFYKEHKDWIITLSGTILGYLLGKFM